MKTLENRTYGQTVYSKGEKLTVINNFGDTMTVLHENGLKRTIPYNRLRLPITDHLKNGYEWASGKRNKLEEQIIKETGIWTLYGLYAVSLWLICVGLVSLF